ncbi:MAG: RES domain-containing protein [Planctomyces sp.]|nr:RES domain-containing protein [Planctomyces sp.]
MEYATKLDVITGAGSRKFGGRWNPPAQFCAVYAALDAETAFGESITTGDKYGISAAMRMPLVTVAIRAELSRILDISAPQIRKKLGVTMAAMTKTDWKAAQNRNQEAFTQLLGRLAFEVGLEGLIVPSIYSRGRQNLVVFPERMLTTSRLEVVNGDMLPEGRGG